MIGTHRLIHKGSDDDVAGAVPQEWGIEGISDSSACIDGLAASIYQCLVGERHKISDGGVSIGADSGVSHKDCERFCVGAIGGPCIAQLRDGAGGKSH